MKMHPAFKTTTRVCAICNKALRRLPNGSYDTTYGFAGILRRNGIKGDKAHSSCVKELGIDTGDRITPRSRTIKGG